MYSERVIQQRSDQATLALRASMGLPKFELAEHSIEQAEELNAHFESRKVDGGLPPDLRQWEVEWITNERTLCALNFLYFATRYGWIKGLQNRVQRFKPNIPQLIVHDNLAEMEDLGVEILQQYLKARRLGISTIIELCAGHRTWFYPHVTTIVGSSDPTSTGKMHKMMTFAYEYLPYWMKPSIVHFKTDKFYDFSNGSYLSLEHGTQYADIGRGNDPSVFHLSECAAYDKPEELIDSGLMRAVIPDPMVFGVLEGTAEGDDGWWYDQYHHNKKWYSRGRARFKAEFLPWFSGVGLYPNETWLRKSPVPVDYKPSPTTQLHARKAKEYVQAKASLRKHLGANWEMPPEQQWFFETNIEEYREKGITHLWCREMAGDDVEAWQSGERSVFDAELLMDYRNAVASPCLIPGTNHPAVFGIRGKGIPTELEPKRSEINKDAPAIKVKVDWTPRSLPLEFELVPLKFQGYSGCDPTGKLFVWEWPKANEIYETSDDTSDGLGEDRSDNTCRQVLRKGDRYRTDCQVAEFCSPDISGADFWPWAITISTFFSVIVNGKRRQPKAVIEVNREGGKELIKQLYKWGWRNFYQHIALDSTRRNKRRPEMGWVMVEGNRNDMLQGYMGAINRRHIAINSPWLISEMGTFIKDDAGKLTAAKGKHDDRLIGLGIVRASMYELDLRSPDPTPYVEKVRDVSETERYPVYRDASQYEKVPAFFQELTRGEYPY